MRMFFCVVILLAAGADALHAQTGPAAPAPVPSREGIAFGAVASPALEGGGPWFMPALRLSVPAGPRYGVDVDIGRIHGGSSKYARIRRYEAVQLRFNRKTSEADGLVRYWLVGLQRLHITKLDGEGTVTRQKHDVPLVVGRGWSQPFRSGARLAAEVAGGGGNGFIVMLSVGVQWGLPSAGG